MSDVNIENCGSIAMITPMTPAGQKWVDENIPYEPWQLMGCSISCEPRCIPAIIEGMQDAGLETS